MIDYVEPSHVFLGCSAKDVDEVFRFISEKAVELGIGTNADTIFKALRAREDMGSTAMTDGFAIPHAQAAGISEMGVIIVKFSVAPEWKSMDDQPISYAIALLTPAESDGTMHLEMLAKIARVLTHPNFRNDMAVATTPDEIADAINKRLHS
jgi:PTS system fructose-specific IIA component